MRKFEEVAYPKPDRCRIKENGRCCKREPYIGGICHKHRMALWRRGLLSSFKVRERRSNRRNIKYGIVKRLCKISENNKACKEEAVTQLGLCLGHYNWFRHRDIKAVERIKVV